MTISSDGQHENSILPVVIIAVLAIALYPAAAVTCVIIYLFKKQRVPAVLPSLAVLLIYLTSIYINRSIAEKAVFELFGSIKRIIQSDCFFSGVKNWLISGVSYSPQSWFTFLCFSVVTALLTSDKLNERVRQIKPLEDDMRETELSNTRITEKGRCLTKVYNQPINGKTIIGTSGGKPVATDDDARHIFCCGTTGIGKTVLLANYIESGILQNYPMLIIDGKGDEGKGSIKDILKRFAADKRVYVIDMNSPSQSSKYNPFKNTAPTICKDMVINMTDWSETHYKANTERYIQRVIQLMEKADIAMSFSAIVEHMSIGKFTELSSYLAKNEIISKSDHIQNLSIVKSSGEIAENASARFSTIIESELGTIFSEDGTDIYGALRENAVILFILKEALNKSGFWRKRLE